MRQTSLIVKWVSVFFWTTSFGMITMVSFSADPPLTVESQVQQSTVSVHPILDPDPEDVPFFRAIADDQDKNLRTCKSQEDCQHFHFLRGLASLYVDTNLAAPHFRKVVTSRPTSRLAAESRFWLWFLDVVSANGDAPLTMVDVTRRLTREIVDREFIVYELAAKLEHTSIEKLQQDVEDRDTKVEELNQVIAVLTKQVEELKKESAKRQSIQKELNARGKKVEELTSQLEALRRIDQELKEKTPPTRPSEKMTPSPELEKEAEK